jgi:hypothetical protein
VTSAITDQEALNVSPEHSRVLLAASSRCGSPGRIRLRGIAKGRCFKNGSNSAADFRAFDPLSQPEARFRDNG